MAPNHEQTTTIDEYSEPNRHEGGNIFVSADDEYEIVHDPYTGDYCVTNGTTGYQKWVRTRDGAIQLALEQVGVLDEAQYEPAPSRCDT